MTLKNERATSAFSERVFNDGRSDYYLQIASDATDSQGLPIADGGTPKTLARRIERDARTDQAFSDCYEGIDLDAVDFLVIAQSCFDALSAIEDFHRNP
jgi:hypothetical protein